MCWSWDWKVEFNSTIQYIIHTLIQPWHLNYWGFKEIKLFFESFDIEYSDGCVKDYVRIISGNYSEKFCGNSIPGPFTFRSHTYISHHADDYGSGSGFNAYVIESNIIHEDECVTLTGPAERGTPCIFPFTLQDPIRTYTGCAEDDGGKWCSTKVTISLINM